MVKYKKGDLLEAPETIIAHGCNSSGGFGSGVAGQIAKKYPQAREAYLRNFNQFGLELGDMQIVTISSPKIIANCMTQKAYLPRDICHANYEAIELAMFRLKKFAKEMDFSIAIPKIGAGLAGGDWNVIEPILEKVFRDYDITVYEL